MDVQRSEVRAVDFVPTQQMTRVYNPFEIVLGGNKSSLKDGVYFTLTALEPAYMLICWGMNIKEAYEFQGQPWSQFRTIFENSECALDQLGALSLAIERRRINTCASQEYSIRPPEALDLGPIPRAKYPLALFLISESIGEDGDELNRNRVVSQIIFFHLNEEMCPAPSHIIGNFVRTPFGQPCNIQPLFTSEDQSSEQVIPQPSYANSNSNNFQQETGELLSREDRTSAQEHDSSNAYESDNYSHRSSDQNLSNGSQQNHVYDRTSQLKVTCVVCQSNLVDRVILPCRHVCVCEICFPLVDRCPMCRGKILSTFSLGGNVNSEPYGYQEDIPSDQEPDESWFMRLNNRLNSFFGFT